MNIFFFNYLFIMLGDYLFIILNLFYKNDLTFFFEKALYNIIFYCIILQ